MKSSALVGPMREISTRSAARENDGNRSVKQQAASQTARMTICPRFQGMDRNSGFCDDMRLGRLAARASLMGPSLLPVPPNTPAPTASLARIQAHPADTGNTADGAKALNYLLKLPVEAAAEAVALGGGGKAAVIGDEQR